jgi:hypothetical protein
VCGVVSQGLEGRYKRLFGQLTIENYNYVEALVRHGRLPMRSVALHGHGLWRRVELVSLC